MSTQYADHELNPIEAHEFCMRLKEGPAEFTKGEYTFQGKDLNGMFYVEVFQNGNRTNFQYGFIEKDLIKAKARYEKELNKLNETVNVRLTTGQYNQLNEIAKTLDKPISELIRDIIDNHLGGNQP